MSKAEFEYWQAVKKNSEDIGGIFGPLPSQINGNLTCISSPSTPVVGYFSATTQQSKRIFVERNILPQENQIDDGLSSCTYRQIAADSARFYINETFLSAIYAGDSPEYYTITGADCADCRLQGGTTKMPSFW